MTTGVFVQMSPAVRVWERQFALFRRVWRSSLIGAFLQPLLYLVGMGVGVGALVDRGPTAGEALGGLTYLAFVAPALIAASAMNVGSQDSLWPMMDGFKWSNAYRAMTATPITPGQVASGIALWHATRATITVCGVAVVLLAFDDTRTAGLLLAVPAGVLTGLAFALPITAWTATRERDISFPAIMRFVIIPMFLFGGVFYPVEQLPGAFQPVARATPLWHGVQLTRGAVNGTLGTTQVLGHGAVLVGCAAAGFVLCRTAFTRRLAS